VAAGLRLALDGDRGITIAAARDGKPLYVPDVRQDPRYVDVGFPAVSELAVPVQFEGRVLGVLNVESEILDAYTPSDVQLLSILANQAALALQNARVNSQERRRADQLAAINRVARRVSATLDLRETLDGIVEAAVELVPCVLAEISLWGEQEQTLTLQALRCEPERAYPIGKACPPGEGYTGWVVRQRQPLLVADVGARDDIKPHLLPGEQAFESYVGVPLLAGDELVGTLVLIHDRAGAFDEPDLELLEGLAGQAAVAIRNASLYQELARRHRELTALNGVAAAMNQVLNLETLLRDAVRRVIRCLGADGGGIRLLDPASGQLTLSFTEGMSEAYVAAVGYLRLGDGIVGDVAVTGESAVVGDMQKDPRLEPGVLPKLREEGLRSLAVVPLRSREKVVGTLGVVSRAPGAFERADLDLLTAMGHQIGVAIENAQLFEETQRKARRLAALNAVASVINQPLSLQEIIDQAIERVIEVTSTDAGGIRLYDQATGELVIASFLGLTAEETRIIERLNLGQGFADRLTQFREPLVIRDLNRFPQLADIAEYGFDTHAYVPVMIKGDTVGVLGVITRQRREFTAEELDLLTAMGHQIGSAIERERLHKDLAQRARELEAAHAVAAAVNRPGELNEILDEGLGQALAVTGLEMGAIFVRDRHTGLLALSCHQGMSSRFVAWLQQMVKEKSEEIWKLAEIWVEQPRIDVEEVPLDSAHISDQVRDEAIRMTADVPLFAEGEVVGILTVATQSLRLITPEERSLLLAIGHQLGTAIANARLRQEALDAERLAAVGRVAASVAHELRSPLGGIKRSAEFLARPELSEATRGRLSQAIVAMAGRLVTTTQELLDYCKGGRMALAPTLCSLPGFLDEMLEVLRVDFSDRGIEVQTAWGYEGHVWMDADRMAQVVYNIAANARDAMPEGGRLGVATQQVGRWVELRFSDTGPGVPSELREHIFEPFVSYGKRQGAGLGLAIARRIVREHGGEICLDSLREEGAAFVVRLPLGENQG
jgi:GAF domain-containing protein